MKKIALVLVLLYLFSLSSYVTANGSIPCEIISSSEINNVKIMSTANLSNVSLYRAAYSYGKLVDIKMQTVSIAVGSNEFNFEEDVPNADKVTFYCWNRMTPQSNTFIKYLKPSYNVFFKDWDGVNLSVQRILEGASATLPPVPGRENYIFAGWDGSYKNITKDNVLTARYVSEGSDNIFSVSSVNGNVGEEVTVTVALNGNVKTCGFDMKLVYDTDALEYIKHEVGTALDVNAGYNIANDYIGFNFSANKNRTKQADIMTVTFKINEAAKAGTVIKLEPVEALSIDENYDILFIVPYIAPRSDVGINFVDGVVFAK